MPHADVTRANIAHADVAVDIAVENLYYAYPPPAPGSPTNPVLHGIEFEIRRGECVALLGRVGAGKSTLCMALNGLVPRATGGIYRGNVRILGLNTKEHPVSRLARHVGLVFEDAESQLVQMRVEDEVAFGCAATAGAPTPGFAAPRSLVLPASLPERGSPPAGRRGRSGRRRAPGRDRQSA